MLKDLIIQTINGILSFALENGSNYCTIFINDVIVDIDSYFFVDDFLYLRWQGSTVAIIHINDIYSIS